MSNRSQGNNQENFRRDFLRGSLILAAVPAGLATPVTHAAGQTPALLPRQIKLGLLGCGRRGVQLAKSALNSKVADCRLTGLADIFADRVQQSYRTLNGGFVDKLNIDSSARHTGLHAAQLLASSDVDAVIVAAATAGRQQQVAVLLQAGKQVLAECPGAVSVDALDQLCSMTSELSNQSSLFWAMPHRYQPFFLSQIEQLNQGAIGDPLLARIEINRTLETPRPARPGHEFEHRLRNWQFDRLLGGHPWFQHSMVALDLVNCVVGELPRAVTGRETSNSWEVEFRYPRGLALTCRVNRVEQPAMVSTLVQVQGTRGWCDLNKGKLYDVNNRLTWNASGSPVDLGPMVDTWLSAIAGSPYLVSRCTSPSELASNRSALEGQRFLSPQA